MPLRQKDVEINGLLRTREVAKSMEPFLAFYGLAFHRIYRDADT